MPPPVIDLDPEQDAESALALMGISLEGVMAELRYRQMKKIEAAYKTQRLAAKINGERRTLHSDGTGGEVVMQIHPVFYHYWGQRLGYDCWDRDRNPEFTREILRDNPELRIKNHVRPGAETRAMRDNRAPTRVRGRRGRWAA